jgi:hypothetical protein
VLAVSIIYSDSELNTTTARHFRSTREAFPDERFPALECPVNKRGHQIVLWLSAVGFAVVALLLLSGVM